MSKKTKKAVVKINEDVLEHVVPILEAIEQLPEAAYRGIRGLTVSDLRLYGRKNEEDMLKAKKRSRKKGQTSATAELDDAVLEAVTSVGNEREDGRVVMRDLEPELPQYSNQQIRRSLVRLSKQKLIKSEGSTKDKSYRAA